MWLLQINETSFISLGADISQDEDVIVDGVSSVCYTTYGVKHKWSYTVNSMYIFTILLSFYKITLQESHEALLSCLLGLKLLGKFLGFVTFLPYQSPEALPESVTDSFVTIRNQVR